MKKRVFCLLLAVLLLLCACREDAPQEESSGFLFYYPAKEVSYGENGAFCSQDAGFDAAAVEPEELLTRYFSSVPPENGRSPLPAEWSFRSVSLRSATANVVIYGTPVSALERSMSATCIAMTLLQLDSVQRVSITAPGSAEPLLLSENDVFLTDTGMLPQEEMLTLYFPDDRRRYLVRETLSVEAMDGTDKPAYIMQQLLSARERGQLTSCIPQGTQLLDISVENGVCTVNLSSEFQTGMERSFVAERMAVYSIVNSLTELPEILPYLRSIVSEAERPALFYELRLYSLLTAVLSGICRAASQRKPVRGQADAYLRIAEYVNLHYAEPLDNGTLAERFGYHPKYIAQLFTRHTGTSLHQYLLKVRLRNAIFLLQTTQLPVSEVARRVGFASASYFSEYFRRCTGYPPSAFRVG